MNSKNASSDSLATSTITGNPFPAKSNLNSTPSRGINFFNKKSSKTQRRIERAANGLSSGFDRSHEIDHNTRPAANPFESLDKDLQNLASATNANRTSVPPQKNVLTKKAPSRPISYQPQQPDQSSTSAAAAGGPQANLGIANSQIIPRSHSDFERLLVSQRLYAQEENVGGNSMPDPNGMPGVAEKDNLGPKEASGDEKRISSMIDHGVEENRPVGNPRRNSFKTVLGVRKSYFLCLHNHLLIDKCRLSLLLTYSSRPLAISTVFPPHQPSAARRLSLSAAEGTTDSSKIRSWLTDVEQEKKNEMKELQREKEKLFNHLI